MRVPNHLLDANHIARIQGNEFESFVRYLLDCETSYRHIQASLEGPPALYHQDGGVDIVLGVTKPPKMTKDCFEGALTEDEVTRTGYLCKTGGDYRAQLVQDSGKPVSIEILTNGGRLAATVNLPLSKQERDRLHGEMIAEIGSLLGVPAELVADRVAIIDANDLESFYSYHPVELTRGLRAILGILELNGLLFYEEWRNFLANQRQWPDYIPDEAREKAIAAIEEVVCRDPGQGGAAAVISVFGPPGVGKSRLVAEALGRDTGVSRRVFAAHEFDYGARAVRELAAPTYGDVVLVIDECPRHEVEGLAALFKARAHGGTGTLILIGPQDGAQATGSDVMSVNLSPLSAPATRQLVEGELGVDPGSESPLVERVLGLSEGYPWFAILLSRALREDPGALPEGSLQWDAAKVAIAGPRSHYGNNNAEWESEVTLRCKALLAVVLTEGIDWRAIAPDLQQRISGALNEDWERIRMAAVRCADRGLIRVRQNWRYKYVTPNNLARLVASELLRPPSGLGRRLRERLPELCGDLYGRLEMFEVGESILAEISEDELRPFVRTANLDDIPLTRLTFLARHQPALTARIIHIAIENTSLEELRAREDIRRNMVFALEHVCRRKQGFTDAEPSLFRLALAENESWTNNATGVWRSLFLGVLSLTHVRFGDRLALLVEHLMDPSTEGRRLALSGLGSAIGSETAGPGYSKDDTVDGEWLRETLGEVRDGKRRAWNQLLTLVDDDDIGGDAREAAISHLRSAVLWGIGSSVFEHLGSVAGGWSDEQKASMREQIRHLYKYEAELLQRDPELGAGVNRLRAAVTPDDFHARMLDVVGQWFPWEDKTEEETYQDAERRVDIALAVDGLNPPQPPLIGELEWLDSEKAVRAVPLMYVVGELDNDWLLLDPLVQRARLGQAQNVISAYLAGRSRVVGPAPIDQIFREWRDSPSLAPHTLLTTWRIGASDERIGWIISDLAEGRLQPDMVGCLTLASWGTGATSSAMMQLVKTLEHSPSVTARVTALDLLKGLQLDTDVEPGTFNSILAGLVASLSKEKLHGLADLVWEQSAKLLIDRGPVDSAIQAAAASIAASPPFGAQHAWRVIDHALNVDALAVWRAIAALIDERPEEAYRITLESQRFGLSGRIQAEWVMDWVGDDRRRSLLAAEMCEVYQPDLSPLGKHLIRRFGADSPAARVLAAKVHSTPGAVSSLAGFSREQMDNAVHWVEDADPEIRKWAATVIEQLRDAFDYHQAHEEFEDRQYR